MPRILDTLILVAALLAPSAVLATVTTSTRTVTYTDGGTVFTVTYPFVGKDHLVVTKVTEATSAEETLTRGTDYSVKLPVGSTKGYITISPAVGSEFTIVIARTVPLTQATSFRTQGAYSARRHEDSLDKLTMIAQELRAVAGSDGTTAVNTHVSESDPHDQYFILDGRSGGQVAYGSPDSGENLHLAANPSEDGKIYVGGALIITVDESTDRVGINKQSPAADLDVLGSTIISIDLTVPTVYGSAAANGDLAIIPTSHGTVATSFIYMGTDGTELVIDDTNNRVGIGTATPSATMDIVGDLEVNGATVLNEAGTDNDTRIEGDTEVNLFFVDASTDRIGIGTATPGVTLDVVGVVKLTGDYLFSGNGVLSPGAGAGTSISIDDDLATGKMAELRGATDEVDGVFNVLATAGDGLYPNATGTGMFGPSHATKSKYLELYGQRVSLMDYPGQTEHSFITEEEVLLDGMLRSQNYVATASVATTVTLAYCGGTYFSSSGVADTVVTLPEITGADDDVGCKITVVSGIASGTMDVTITPHADNPINGSCAGITGAGAATIIEASGTNGETWNLTAATSNKGDYTTLISDDKGASWWIVGCIGEWVSAGP